MARARLKRAVFLILTKLQAYHLYEKIKRNKKCIIPIKNYMPNYQPLNPNKQLHLHGSKCADIICDDSDEESEREEDSSQGSMNMSEEEERMKKMMFNEDQSASNLGSPRFMGSQQSARRTPNDLMVNKNKPSSPLNF